MLNWNELNEILSPVNRHGRSILSMALAMALVAGSAWGQGTGTPGRGLFLPFDQEDGQWRICQGYNGTISHQDDYALDITINPDEPGATGCTGAQHGSSGQSLYAPGAGTSTLLGGTGQFICLDLEVGGSLKIGHFDPATRVGGDVGELQYLGAVDAADEDNGRYAHIHIQAYPSNNCSGDDVPFAGDYKFFGVPNLDDLSATLVTDANHHTGTWLMSRMIDDGSDDAGRHWQECAEDTDGNEIYLGYCDGIPGARRKPILSGLRYSNLDIAQGSHITAASLVVKVDGQYTAHLDLRWHIENNLFAPPFSSVNPPSARRLRTASQRWQVANDTWELGETRETTNLRELLQGLVDIPWWNQDANSIALIAAPNATGFSSNSHRRFIAIERNNLADPLFYPARLVVTRFGNNPPVANAGPNQEAKFAGQQINLDGTASYDVEGALEFSWKQLLGTPVKLYNHTTATPYFKAIHSFYVFELTVTDRGRSNGASKMIDKDYVTVLCEECA